MCIYSSIFLLAACDRTGTFQFYVWKWLVLTLLLHVFENIDKSHCELLLIGYDQHCSFDHIHLTKANRVSYPLLLFPSKSALTLKYELPYIQ